MEGIFRAWGAILSGRTPLLSIELTRECPLRCPGCYAYEPEHLGGGVTLRQVSDLKGQALIDGVLQLLDQHRPLHVSLIGGEPLVRYRELDELLPLIVSRGIYVQLVTSAVRPIPEAWAKLPRLQICVSIDGLQEEHDQRRAPATYDRILKNIEGHQIVVHCTVTSQQVRREDYLEDFVKFWSAQSTAKKIWMSLYTPQMGDVSVERLSTDDRARAIAKILSLRQKYPKLDMSERVLEAYSHPPATPEECIFAKITTCVSADLERKITPCQFGGTPDCTNCGCMASAGMSAIGRYSLLPGLKIGDIFNLSFKVGDAVNRLRRKPEPTATVQQN